MGLVVGLGKFSQFTKTFWVLLVWIINLCSIKFISSDKVFMKAFFKSNKVQWLKQFITCILEFFSFNNVPTLFCSPIFVLAPSTLIPTNLSIKSFHFTFLKAFSIEGTILGALATFIGPIQRYFILGTLAFKYEM